MTPQSTSTLWIYQAAAAAILVTTLSFTPAVSQESVPANLPPGPPPAPFILKATVMDAARIAADAAPAAAFAKVIKIPDYDSLIKASLKERERRLALLNEALLRLQDAGEINIARRVETRIQSLLEMSDPLTTDAVVEQMDELGRNNEKLKAENKELLGKLENAPPEDPKVT